MNHPAFASASTIDAAAFNSSVEDLSNCSFSCAFNLSCKSLSGTAFSIVENSILASGAIAPNIGNIMQSPLLNKQSYHLFVLLSNIVFCFDYHCKNNEPIQNYLQQGSRTQVLIDQSLGSYKSS